LIDRLKELEAAHPELITPDSPTQRIGDQPISSLKPVEHREPMLSIDNTYSVEELRKYADRIAKLLPGEEIEWVVELKVDGVAARTIRMLDPRECASRRLRMFFHGVGYSEGLEAETHMEFLKQLRAWGLAATPNVKAFKSIDALIGHCDEVIAGLHNLDFEVD